MGNKKSKTMYKIVVSIIFCIVVICTPKMVFGKTIDLSKDKEMEPIVMGLCNWEIEYGNKNGSNPTAAEIAKKIIELCGGDETKIKKLQNSYSSGGIIYWHGDDPNSTHYTGTNLAIESNKNNTEIEEGDPDGEVSLSEEIAAIAVEINLYNGNPSVEDLKRLDAKLKEYYNKYGTLPESLLNIAQKVKEKLEAQGETGETAADKVKDMLDGREEDEESSGKLGSSTASAIHTPDEIITEANEFVSQGTTSPIDGKNVKAASSTLYNLLLSIGIFLSVAIGVYLGVKFMLSTAEDKAKVKEALIPYIVGCIVIFSAFIIWKAVIELLGGIS